MSSESIIEANGVELCVETFGSAANPVILLIAGAASSMLSWDDELCERLAAGSRFVIRYDHRDTGRSVNYEPGAPQYSFRDLVADAVGVLDHFGVGRAHLVGMSMGGMIGQLVALDYPERVASLTLISTSPGGPDLPGSSEELRAHFASVTGEPDWSDRAAVIDYVADDARAHASTLRPFDEEAWRDLAARDFDRTVDLAASMTNHFAIDDGESWRQRLGDIRVPTLVVHGAEDPLFPLAHAIALTNEIPDARLLTLDETGHELPRAVWDETVPAILQHTALA